MTDEKKKKKKNKIWEIPEIPKSVSSAVRSSALTIKGADTYDTKSTATQYEKAGRPARGQLNRLDRKPPRPGPVVPKPTRPGPVVPKPTLGTTARETLGSPLYTNIPSGLSEPGAMPIPARPVPGRDRFSNIGSFNFGKPTEEPVTPFLTLSKEEATRRGALVGQTGEQYNLMRESEHTKRLRVGAIQRGELALEKEKAELIPGEYQTDVVGGPDFSQQIAITGPRGRTRWESPPVTESGVAEIGPLEILSAKDFMAKPEAQQKAYMARLEKENTKAFLDLRKALKLDVRE